MFLQIPDNRQLKLDLPPSFHPPGKLFAVHTLTPQAQAVRYLDGPCWSFTVYD